MAKSPSSRKSRANGRSSTAAAVTSRLRILRAARELLVEDGYAELSMRTVAHRAGMAVGNLVYYFPSKRSLAHAVIFDLLAEYRTQSQRLLRSKNRGRGLSSLIRFYIADSASRETSRLFRELWVMALHDPAIATAMDQFYGELHEIAIAFLRETHPQLNGRAAADIVELMGAISEGANILFATGRSTQNSIGRVARLAGECLDAAITSVTAPEPRPRAGTRPS